MFDNVVLAAADANNQRHANWVDLINVRHRVYVAINENDYALRASRMKLGDAQLARLGHYTRELNAERATYIDFTDTDRVGNAHSYFIGDPAKKHVRETVLQKSLSRSERRGRPLVSPIRECVSILGRRVTDGGRRPKPKTPCVGKRSCRAQPTVAPRQMRLVNSSCPPIKCC